jgi:hypothetical protein
VPELFAVAAEQYLPVVSAVADAAEQRQVAGLLWRAAGQATLIGDYALVKPTGAVSLRRSALARRHCASSASSCRPRTGLPLI